MARAKENPSYNAVLPGIIRYAEDLSLLQKILYAEIDALSNKYGYCFASNWYFADLYRKDPTWISKMISDMDKKWYLELTREAGSWYQRKIFIGKIKNKKKRGKKSWTPQQDGSCGKVQRGLVENCNEPLQKTANIIIQDNKVSVIGNISTHTYLEIRNKKTGNNDVKNSSIKSELEEIKKSITPQNFLERVSKFVEIMKLIKEKKTEKYFYIQPNDRDFPQFLRNINTFYEKKEVSVVLSQLAKFQERSQAVRKTLTDKAQEEEQTTVIQTPLTEEEKKKKISRLREIQKKILSK